MFRFLKNIYNAVIIVLVCAGLNNLYNNHFFDNIIADCTSYINAKKSETLEKVGDFSRINPEFSVDTAINIFGYKAVLAEHKSSGQRMIVLDSGKKPLLTVEDIRSDGIKYKLEDLSSRLRYESTNVSEIDIVDRGQMFSYGEYRPYVRFNAKVTRLPISNVTGIISINDDNPKEQRLLVSVNDRKKYSQLIASEFYKEVRETR